MRKLDYDQIITEIQDWIREYVANANADGIVVGLSGGIDSSLTSTLCVNALGKTRVIGLGLPCESNPKDLNDAKLIAAQLGIKFIVLDLSSIYEEFLRLTSSSLKSNNLSNANLKARLRMTTWYFASQSMGNYLIGGTGNRTELAIGYFTKYGDGGIDFEPIGGLYKCEVRFIANRLNIPDCIINKPPSAGLCEGQTDEGEIGMKYDELDEIIYRIDYGLSIDDLDIDKVKKVKDMIRLAEHKNKMPPLYKIFK